MNDIHVVGFMIVRRPEFNFGEFEIGPFASKPPMLRNKWYGGIDRMAWFDILQPYYANRLPRHLSALVQRYLKRKTDFTGIHLCQEYDKVNELLEYANSTSQLNEIVAVRSRLLAETFGKTPSSNVSIKWTGFDAFVHGGWSLLLAGLFTAPLEFSQWQSVINADGLLPNAHAVDGFFHEYLIASEKGAVEPIPTDADPNGSVYRIDAIEVGRLAP